MEKSKQLICCYCKRYFKVSKYSNPTACRKCKRKKYMKAILFDRWANGNQYKAFNSDED